MKYLLATSALLLGANADKYFVIPSAMDETTAEAQCAAQGGALASIHSLEDFAEATGKCILTVQKTGGSGADGCWLGLKDDQTEGVWRNVDGSASDFMMDANGKPFVGVFPWHSGEPNNWGGNEDCAHIWRPQYWDVNDMPCTDQNYPVCETLPLGSTPSMFFTLPDAVTQERAAQLCDENDAILATILSDAEFAEAAGKCMVQVGDSGTDGCWLGLKDDVQENYWLNADGSSNPYMCNDDGSAKKSVFPWYSGEPNDWGSGEDCTHLWRPQYFQVNDMPCTDINYPLCRVREPGCYDADDACKLVGDLEARVAALERRRRGGGGGRPREEELAASVHVSAKSTTFGVDSQKVIMMLLALNAVTMMGGVYFCVAKKTKTVGEYQPLVSYS